MFNAGMNTLLLVVLNLLSLGFRHVESGVRRIVGGQSISIGKVPYQVSLQFKNNNEFHHACGAAIISEYAIISAAHCVIGSKTIAIRAGSEYTGLGGQFVSAKKVVTHQKFSKNPVNHDLAIIFLEKKLSFNDNVQPVQLPTSGSYEENSLAMVTGWGRLAFRGGIPTSLQTVMVPIVNHQTCVKAYEKVGKVAPQTLCAGFLGVGGRDTCQGDSGGPLVQNNTLIGIVSWGFGCAESKFPGIYTKISAYVKWIENTMQGLKHTHEHFSNEMN